MLRATVPRLTSTPLGGKVRLIDKLLINGKFVPSRAGKLFDVFNPATGEVLAKVHEAEEADIDLAVEAAQAAFVRYRETDGSYRRDLMLRLADLIHAHRDELATIESLDNGKPFRDALHLDLAGTVECFRYYAGYADKISGQLLSSSGNSMALLKRQPIGVCGQIIPWNFPLLMASWKLAPALALGNTVVLKPAEQTPLSALRLGELVLEAGYPAGVVNIVPGNGAVAGKALTVHPGSCKVAFTGSTEVGRQILRMSGESNLKKVSLELGGKSPLVVCADADLGQAVEVAARGIFSNAGQVCCAASRMYVHESLYDSFVQLLQAKAEQIQVKPGLEEGSEMGPLVSQEQLDRVLRYLEIGRKEGAVTVTGGCRLGDKGYFVKPTILTNVNERMRVCQEEIFGPVTCIMPFKDMEEAMRRANDTAFGLAAGICTRDVDTALRYSTYLDAGTVWINGWNMLEAGLPFGGFKESGHGRELGPDALDLYTQSKTIHISLNGPIVKP